MSTEAKLILVLKKKIIQPRFNGHHFCIHCIMLQNLCSTIGLSILIHGVISLQDPTPCDKIFILNTCTTCPTFIAEMCTSNINCEGDNEICHIRGCGKCNKFNCCYPPTPTPLANNTNHLASLLFVPL